MHFAKKKIVPGCFLISRDCNRAKILPGSPRLATDGPGLYNGSMSDVAGQKAEMRQVMGNEAIALGALAAGVNLVAGYPGTPSSEIIECISRYNKETGAYVEWSVNEKAAAEVAAAASVAGSRSLITMKQVGLNVAADPLMCLAYVGVRGGMVIVSADDPGPISSQTEQDTRIFARFSKMPLLDPSSPAEAFRMVQEAFDLSEKYNTPVIVRPTTRVCHAYESMEVPPLRRERERGSFVKDTARWVIFPRASFLNHKRIFERNERVLPDVFSSSPLNRIERPFAGGTGPAPAAAPCGTFGIACSGISYAYVREALEILRRQEPSNPALAGICVLKVATPYPFPESLAADFLRQAGEVLAVEELDPVVERELIYIEGKFRLDSAVHGKLDGSVAEAGENTVEGVRRAVAAFIGIDCGEQDEMKLPDLPVRPPVLCAGCPHRGAFYAVKLAAKGAKTAFCGDIGCYTLGNSSPLDMCDSCLCMGADITMAQGFYHNEPDRLCFSFIGDSTFFASGIPGVINAVYNQSRQVICVLDNSTTAMTGHQPHPGTGRTMMGEIVDKISIEKILSAIGVSPVLVADPFDTAGAVSAVKEAAASPGVSAVIFRAPCIAVAGRLGHKFPAPMSVDSDRCVGCRKCVSELGCPAISVDAGSRKPVIDKATCTACGLCSQVCPVQAIGEGSGR